MHLQAMRVKNYRRLKDVCIDIDDKNTIFVGANNSGKTSAVELLKTFFGKERFSIYDFSASVWPVFHEIAENTSGKKDKLFPVISLDLWFSVAEGDLYRVVKLLPSLDWDRYPIGMRLEFSPKNSEELLSNYREAKRVSSQHANDENDYHPWPESLFDYLKKQLRTEYRLKYYVLDFSFFDSEFNQKNEYSPHELNENNESGAKILSSIIKVDFMAAQRHLSDSSSGAGETLSKRISKFYKGNIEQFESDFSAISTLAQSESTLNEYFKKTFGPTLNKLNDVGYPNFANPDLMIKSAFDLESLLSQSASVHYALREPGHTEDDTPPVLPDKYNGLGFKNLIYMVIEILDFYNQWKKEDEKRPPIHLVFIEEPEAHLHIQLQQVFIKRIRTVLPQEGGFSSQLIVTTHSPHIIYESGFTPIRYFRRMLPNSHSDVLNLTNIPGQGYSDNKFLYQYMKLTHCDLFFADAAILVEGNVERLLLPLMIDREAPDLNLRYLTILEVGGAFAHIFRNIINFLGLTTLVITDLDSVKIDGDKAEDDTNPNNKGERKQVCRPEDDGATTSNQTLIKWIPGLTSVESLLDSDASKKCNELTSSKVRVAYQTRQTVTWKDKNKELAGRTFEESFAYQNLEWCQKTEQNLLRLRVQKSEGKALEEVVQEIHSKISKSSFKKTEFALALMTSDAAWKVPDYIAEGLQWLSKETAVSDGSKAVDQELPQ